MMLLSISLYKKKFLTLSILTALLAGGCSFFRPVLLVEVVIPPGPWEKAGVPVFHLLRFPSRDGESLRTLRVPAGTDRVLIELPRGEEVPVLAYPLGRLNPSGGITGLMTAGDLLARRRILKLDAAVGTPAEIILELLREKDRLRTVNLRALLDEMREECGGDPRACDLDRIRQAILTGTLNRLQVRSRELFSHSLELPAEDWLAGSELFRGEIMPGEGGSVEFRGLYPGTHCFYSPLTGMELHLYVEKKGDCRSVVGSLQDFKERF